jgi:hypothetical protein
MAELPTRSDFKDYAAWSGRAVLGPDGDRLGSVEAIFLDEATDVPEWVLVRLGDDGDSAFVPLVGARVESDAVRVEQPRDRVEAAPRPDAGETLSVADERRLYDHYGLAYSESESQTVLPERAMTSDEPTPAAETKPRLRRFEGTPPPIPIPEPPPRVIPPSAEQLAGRESRLPGMLRGRPAVPIALGAAIAALIALLVWRNRR